MDNERPRVLAITIAKNVKFCAVQYYIDFGNLLVLSKHCTPNYYISVTYFLRSKLRVNFFFLCLAFDVAGFDFKQHLVSFQERILSCSFLMTYIIYSFILKNIQYEKAVGLDINILIFFEIFGNFQDNKKSINLEKTQYFNQGYLEFTSLRKLK